MNKREYFFKNQILTDGLEDFIVTEAHGNFLMIKMIGGENPIKCNIVNNKAIWKNIILNKADYSLRIIKNKDGSFLKRTYDKITPAPKSKKETHKNKESYAPKKKKENIEPTQKTNVREVLKKYDITYDSYTLCMERIGKISKYNIYNASGERMASAMEYQKIKTGDAVFFIWKALIKDNYNKVSFMSRNRQTRFNRAFKENKAFATKLTIQELFALPFPELEEWEEELLKNSKEQEPTRYDNRVVAEILPNYSISIDKVISTQELIY